MAACLEIQTGPLTLWWAAVGTAMPAVNDDAATGFAKIGTSGDQNYAENGVEVIFERTIESFRSLGSTHKICLFPTEQDISVTVSLVDMTLAQVRQAMNLNAVTTDTTPDINILDLDFGLSLSDLALLVRGTGNSGEFAGANLQWECNRAVEVGNHTFSYTKGSPVTLELEYDLLLDDSGNVGRLVQETS